MDERVGKRCKNPRMGSSTNGVYAEIFPRAFVFETEQRELSRNVRRRNKEEEGEEGVAEGQEETDEREAEV